MPSGRLFTRGYLHLINLMMRSWQGDNFYVYTRLLVFFSVLFYNKFLCVFYIVVKLISINVA